MALIKVHFMNYKARFIKYPEINPQKCIIVNPIIIIFA